jgi:hypothetical protein
LYDREVTSSTGSVALGWLAAAQDAIERMLSPRGRRLAVTAVLLTTFVLVTTARVLNAIRLDTFGIDLRIYRAAAEAALAGRDPWAASVSGLTFAGPPPTLLAYLPAAVLPEAVAVLVYAAVAVVAAVAALRAVHLPLWWLLFPPISESLIVLNPDVMVIALLVAAPRFAALAVPLKVYAAVPLALSLRWRALVVGLALCLVSVPWWSDFLAARDAISASLDVQSSGGASAWGTWLMIPTLVALAVLFRRGAEWLAVPAVWPYTQLHYAALALPIAAKNAFVALLLCFAVPFAAPVATIVYAIWVVLEPRLAAYRAGVGAAKTEPSPSV